MFLNKTRFKKWAKDAYKYGGLTVGQIYGGLVVSGGAWVIWTQEGYVPNWVKAALMEHTGELPKKECLFKAKNGEPIQYEIAENDYLDLPGMYMKAKVPFTVTPIVYERGGSQFRFLQSDNTGALVAVTTYLFDILDMSELEEENRPTGPCSLNDSGGFLLWKNEHSALMIAKTDVSGDKAEVMNLLSTYSFEKEAI